MAPILESALICDAHMVVASDVDLLEAQPVNDHHGWRCPELRTKPHSRL